MVGVVENLRWESLLYVNKGSPHPPLVIVEGVNGSILGSWCGTYPITPTLNKNVLLKLLKNIK